jgi:two-component system, cell cycle sensor histidine kinase and response regulator CckA
VKEKIRVLYAEDNLADADLTKSEFELEAPDFEIEVVGTGQQCVALLKNDGNYDVLLLDYALPDRDAIDVLKELSAREILLPVVVVTGVGDEDLVVQLLRLGAWDYIPKQGNYVKNLPPILRNTLAEYRMRQQQWKAAGPEQARVLYVEHNEADIDLTQKHFSQAAAHLNLEVVHSATNALTRLQEDTFDLVLSDLRLTDMSALDLLSEAKHRGVTVPFVIITGKGDEGAAVAALKLGAYDYILKRDNYLTQLPYAIDNAIARSQLAQSNRQLRIELAERERAEAEKARLEEKLRQAQKLESLGQLAGGVAHDFNNLLNVVIGYASLLQSDPGTEKVNEWATEILKAGARATSLSRQMLAFSRKQNLKLDAIDLNETVSDMSSMLRRLIREDIELQIHPASDLPCVMADANQIQQVIMNLAVNARDAMPEGGRLIITTSKEDLDREHASSVGLVPGSYAVVRVRDTGHGMDRETQTRIFEPYFTTKDVGKGTGLGLATVHGIVAQSGGAVHVMSEVGAGTTFSIYLPAGRENAPATISSVVTMPNVVAIGTILLVEDEESLRTLSKEVLQAKGYSVLEAANGATALDVASSHPGAIQLLVTDMIMPGMQGRELILRMRQQYPGIKVLCITGYSDPSAIAGLGVGLLEKPFTPSTLVIKVAELLASHDEIAGTKAV